MTTTASTPPQGDTSSNARAWLRVAVLCFGGLCVSLTQTLVIPVQQVLPVVFDTTIANASWVVTVTLLAGAVSMPISGRLGDLFGKQPVLLGNGAFLVVGSVVCALADSLAPLLVGRALQGVSLGFIPVAIALVRELTPPAMVGTAIASVSATLGVGGAIGLPVAAYTAEQFGIAELFWGSTVLAVVMIVLLATLVPRNATATRGRVDLIGAAGLAAGLVGVLLAVSKGNDWGWTSPLTVSMFTGGVIVLVAWGFFELRQGQPLVDLRVTVRRPVLLTNLAAVAIGFGMMAQAISLPQLLQLPSETGYGLGQTMLQAGLWMAPGGLMMLVFAPVASRLLNGVGPRRTLMIGAGTLAVGYLVAFFFYGAPWQLLIAACVASAGVGIGYAAMPTLIMARVPLTEAGSAVGINALMRSVGTTTAAAVMAAILSGSVIAFGDVVVPSEAAFRTCFLVGSIAAAVGVLITALVPRDAPAVTNAA